MPIGLTHHSPSLTRQRRRARTLIAKIDKLAKLPTFGDLGPMIPVKATTGG